MFPQFFTKMWVSSLTGLLSCGAVSTKPENAIESTYVYFVGEGWLLTSLYAIISQLSHVLRSPYRRIQASSFSLLSSSFEDLSCLAFLLW